MKVLAINSSPEMDEGNTINGLPIFYRYNYNFMNAKVKVENRSQIILIDILNVNIHDFQSAGSECALIMLNCSYIELNNCSMMKI